MGLVMRSRSPSSILTLLVLLSSSALACQLRGDDSLNWKKLGEIPNSLGIAGPVCGTDGGSLIVAGGANFPEAPPWEHGRKVWHDKVFVLEDADSSWKEVGRLPRRLGYSVSISIPSGFGIEPGVAYFGGSNSDGHDDSCGILRWKDGELEQVDLPSLPRPCANGCGALLGDSIYIAGGLEHPGSSTAMRQFWKLNLRQQPLRWEELSPWPGAERMLAVAAVQDGAFFLSSGVALAAGLEASPTRIYLQDAYRYRPREGWVRIADLPRPAVAAASPAPAIGQSSFLVLGGDDGTLVDFRPLANHPGFPQSILTYHTITDSWKTLPHRLPASHVTTSAVPWERGYVIPSGETRPGIRSPEVWSFTTSLQKQRFGWLNYVTVVAYLLLMLWIGWICSKRNRSTNDYFRGGQRIPWWAAGLSIFATMLSAITYMAIPAAAYSNGWGLFLANTYILIMPLIVFVFLPFYRRLNVTSAYEYLEHRFNLATRWIGSVLFILYQCGRIAIVLYLPSLALATVSDLEVETCIVGIGLLCIIYTVAGGMEAVIWTDVIQAIVLLSGAVVSLIYLMLQIDGGIWKTIDVASASGRFFEAVSWNWDITIASAWVIMIGSCFHQLLPYSASQDVVQRYLTTPDEKTAARGIWLNALLSVPAQAVFFAIGTGLFVFYKQHPEKMDISLQNDAVFPFFIVGELPWGLAGLIVAGIFSASQSTLSSGINSISAAYVVDFYHRRAPHKTDQQCLTVAKRVTVIVGFLGIGIALVLSRSDIRSAYSTSIELLGLLGGILSGLFMLGIFTERAHGKGALAGALISAIVVLTIRFVQPLQVFAYAPIGLMSCFFSGYFLSRIVSDKTKNLSGLTVYSMRPPVSID